MRLLRFFTVPGLKGLVWIFLLAALMPAVRAEDKTKDNAVIFPRSTENRAEVPANHNSSYSGVLAAALLLAVAGGWLFWRGRAAPGGAAKIRKLAIAETKSLGNRQYLVVATYEDKTFLLSVCPGRIELLTPLDAVTPVKSP